MAKVAEQVLQRHIGYAGEFDRGGELTCRKIIENIRALASGSEEGKK